MNGTYPGEGSVEFTMRQNTDHGSGEGFSGESFQPGDSEFTDSEPQFIRHYKIPKKRPFTKDQRPATTVLFGGLTWKHERLIQAVFQSLGYVSEFLPSPSLPAYHRGREYCNNGQCNPAYFTIGNLILYLKSLRAQGLTQNDILDKYVFFTAGACGPCRFGMYESEYRLALRNAGFEGFRVITIKQTGGLDQAEANDGLELNLDFTVGLIYAFMLADVLNDLVYRIRPYEIEQGSTNQALEESIEHMAAILTHTGKESSLNPRETIIEKTLYLIRQLRRSDIIEGMEHCLTLFRRIRIDRTRVRPVVKITGEFWAQTTEGDGNYNMFTFLEDEGAEVLIEPITPWLSYMLHQAKQSVRDRRITSLKPAASKGPAFLERVKGLVRYYIKYAKLTAGERLLGFKYDSLRKVLLDLPQSLPNQYTLQKIADPYYNSRIEGGEGHLEVAKTIYYTRERLCHLVLSIKPFGCLPSTQSDGVQSAVISHFPEILFLPIETSGEGEINAHSRVQMALTEARQRAMQEFNTVLERFNLTTDELRELIKEDPSSQDPFYRVPKTKEYVGQAANFVHHFASTRV